MNKFSHFVKAAFLIVLIGCENQLPKVEAPDSNAVFHSTARLGSEPLDDLAKDKLVEKFSKAVASACLEPAFRRLIKDEALKRFDYDYDVLISFLLSRHINSSQYGDILVADLLLKVSPNQLKQSDFDQVIQRFKNLQISMTLNGEEWDPSSFIPRVAAITSNYDEKNKSMVEVFHSNGQIKLMNDEQAKATGEVFLFVRESERVDKDGLLRVDQQGFVLDKDQRILTSEVAYMQAAIRYRDKNLGLRTGRLSSINIVSDQQANNMQVTSLSRPLHTTSVVKNSTNSRQNKIARRTCSSYPATPSQVIAIASNPGEIRIQWASDIQVQSYRIYREAGYSET